MTGLLSDRPLIQVCWVVDDIDAAVASHRALGVESWTVMSDVVFDAEHNQYGGQPAEFAAHIGLAYSRDLQLELIQPTAGASIYADFLAAGGPGLHHVAIESADLDADLTTAAEAGLTVAQGGSMADGAIRYAYLDGLSWGTPYVELMQIEPWMRAFYDGLKTT